MNIKRSSKWRGGGESEALSMEISVSTMSPSLRFSRKKISKSEWEWPVQGCFYLVVELGLYFPLHSPPAPPLLGKRPTYTYANEARLAWRAWQRRS